MKRYCITSILCFVFSCVLAQGGFDFYVSNAGNDVNTGTTEAPKRTIAGVAATVNNASLPPGELLKVGFRSGDIFTETFSPGYPVKAGTYFPSGGKAFAIMKGSKEFNAGWDRSGTNMFHQKIALNGYSGYGINNIGSYSFVYVFEIDRQLELTAPITARRMLQFAFSLADATSTPGSFYESALNGVDSIDIYINTSDGLSPNNHPRYRYEVSTRDRAINSTEQSGNYFEKLWITGFGAGNGMIPAGPDTRFNRMIFGPGAAVHHLGLRGAEINNSLFLPGPKNTNGYAVVFYDVEGYKRHNTIRNSIFMDIKYPVYTHKSFGQNFGALEMDNVIAFADTTEAISFVETLDTDSAIINNVYSDQYPYGYNMPRVRYASVKNSVFKDVKTGIAFPGIDEAATVTNNLVIVSGTRNGTRGNGISVSVGNRVVVSNNIVHFKNNIPVTSAYGLTGYLLAGAGRAGCSVDVTGNIFISDVAPGNYVITATANTDNGAGRGTDRWRNNVYILAGGRKMSWWASDRTSNNGTNEINSFQQWQQQSGQDRNGLFFDLRNDPRGLKAIFTDPDNGDYSLANTIEANAIRSVRAGMINPVTCFLKRPTYEEAAKIIMNDGTLTAGACRKPCNQNNIRTTHSFTSSLAGNNKMVQLDWHIEDESAVDHYEIMRSFGNSDFTTIASLPAETRFDYTYTDSNSLAGITYRYCVALITRLNEKCYSEITVAKTDDGRPFNVYPNPSRGKINIGLNAYTGPVKVTIHNVLGRKVYERELSAYYGTPLQVDLSNQSKGFYWINVQAAGSSSKQGFVLQ